MAHHRHKRDTNARRLVALTGSRAATIAARRGRWPPTVPAVALGVARRRPAPHVVAGGRAGADPPSSARPRPRYDRPRPISRTVRPGRRRAPSRTASRPRRRPPAAVKQRPRQEVDHRRPQPLVEPAEAARQVGELTAGKQVLVTGRAAGGRAEVVVDGQVALGHRRLPRRREARPGARPAGRRPVDGALPRRLVENGLTSGAVYVYRSVCHAFPQITSYGGWDAHGEHASRPGARHHDQRRRARQRDRRVPAGARLRAAPLRHPLAPAHLDAGARRPRAGGCSPTAARRRPTTTTTCTSSVY